MKETLKKVTQAFGVSGHEDEVRDVIIEEIKQYVDEIKTDAMGNLIAIKKGTKKKIMLAAHMDEIGIIATYIDDKGFIRFSNIGGVSPYFALNQRVKFQSGVIGCVAAEGKLPDYKNLNLSKMFIDIGCKDKAETEKYVNIGDVATFVGDFYTMGDVAVSKAMDNRSGCAVLIEMIKSAPKTDNEIYYVFTTQEEVGLRGAKTAAYAIMPDCALAIDITTTADTPECHKHDVIMTGGPALKIKDAVYIAHPEIRRLLEETAKEQNIPFTRELLERGGTDCGAIQTTGIGVPCGGISIACRYIHSPCEMVSITDLNNCVKLAIAFVQAYK